MHSLYHRALALIIALGTGSTAIAAQSAPATPAAPAAAASTAKSSPSAALTEAPFKRGDRIFNADASGSLYVRDSRDGKPRLILAGGSYGTVAPSSDGQYIAYTLPTSTPGRGSAAADLRVRSVQTARDMPEVLHGVIISRKAWTHNEKGFFYTREDPADQRQRVYYHGLGKDQSRDAVVLSQFDHPEWRYDASVSDDGQFAVFTIGHPVDSHTRLYFIDMDNPGHPTINAPVVRLIDAFSARYQFVDNAGSYFFLQTDRDAARGSVVLANTDVTRASSWPVVIRQSTDTLLYVRTAGEQFVLPVYRTANVNMARVYGPPDRAELRAEFQKRLDSLKKERADAERNRHRDRDVSDAMRMRAPAAIRLERTTDFPLPAGASIMAMNTVADNEEVFYTLRMADGSTRSFLYNINNKRTEPFPPAPQTR